MSMSGKNKRIALLLAALISSVLLTGCPEMPDKSLRQQVREAEQASGYVNGPSTDEPTGETVVVN